MKNVTVSLDDDVAHWARVWAAEHDSSVSRMLGSLLKATMRERQGYDAAMHEFLAVEPQPLRKPREPMPDREAIHERD
jgi:plasmid stability protein